MPDELKATVSETVFRNEENGYTVLQVRTGRESLTVVGVLPEMAAGEQAVFEGVWMSHPQYGKQFKATACEIKKPTTMLGVERYLASGLIRGVGPATAKLIVQEFGTKSLDVLSEHPEWLTRIAGIGPKRAAQIAKSFHEQYAVRQAMVFLQTYGVPPALSVRISKKYGERAQELIRENPYRLVEDIEGIGFLTADRIAVSLGIPPQSEYRLRAGIKYVLSEAASSSGHTYLPRDELLSVASRLLRIPAEILDTHAQALILSGDLRSCITDGKEGIFLSVMWQAESEIASRLARLLSASQTLMDPAIEKQIADFEEKRKIRFSKTQRSAIAQAVQNSLFVITGGPGTGKTTLINCILTLLGGSGKVKLAAPTGRAAKRMSEATGCEAKTLHRLLEYGGEDGSFQRDENNPIDCACLIVDEMSMVDIFLMRSLLRALRSGTRLILVGDADQLPSVGAGNVLRDILDSGAVPSVRLTEIFRQDEGSMIVHNAHAINRGDMPVLNRRDSNFYFERRLNAEEAAQTVVQLCSERLPAFLEKRGGAHSLQVLSPARKGACGVTALNRMLQSALNPPSKDRQEMTYGETVFRTGDKVMHVKNNYSIEWTDKNGEEGIGVFNGDMGVIRAIDTEEREVHVMFDDDRAVTYEYQQLEELELAYCLSVHKSQGSEFSAVVLPCVGGPPMLLTRNLFYTALTRAKEMVVLVGREGAIQAMVENNHIAKRYTALRERLCCLPGRAS